jgi:catechol 2,3-dioxygenase-like lactoylglutathione lyase family enzyme
MAIARLMTNICSHNLAASRDFYRDLLGLQVTYDSDWFIQLRFQTTIIWNWASCNRDIH